MQMHVRGGRQVNTIARTPVTCLLYMYIIKIIEIYHLHIQCRLIYRNGEERKRKSILEESFFKCKQFQIDCRTQDGLMTHFKSMHEIHTKTRCREQFSGICMEDVSVERQEGCRVFLRKSTIFLLCDVCARATHLHFALAGEPNAEEKRQK